MQAASPTNQSKKLRVKVNMFILTNFNITSTVSLQKSRLARKPRHQNFAFYL